MIKPRGSVTRSSTPRKAFASFLEPQVEICAWCPDEHAKLPPEQVHFIIHWPAGMQLKVRRLWRLGSRVRIRWGSLSRS
jgi:hypothetical protein